jgi:hypothetical protein
MNRLIIRRCLWMALALAVLGLCLFGDCTLLKNNHVLASALAEIAAVLGDPGTQWMVFACAGVYFLAFVVLRSRLAGGGATGPGEGGGLRVEDGATGPSELWLLGLLAVAAVAYALDYSRAAQSTHALTLLGATALGQGAAFWEAGKQKAESRNGLGGRPKSNGQSPKSGAETVIGVLILLLVVAAVWQTEAGQLFQYRRQARLCGPWDNPNTFGMLMGVGIVLAVGMAVLSLKSKVQSQVAGEHPTSNIQHPTSNIQLGTLGVAGAAGGGGGGDGGGIGEEL